MNKTIVFLMTIIFLTIFSFSIYATNNVGVSIKGENSSVHELLILGGDIDIPFYNDEYVFNGFLGMSTDFAANQFYIQMDVLKEINKTKNYYMGLGYKYINDKFSSYRGGGEMSQNVLYAKFVGTNHYNGFDLKTDISYSPLADFKYLNNEKMNMSSWFVEFSLNKEFMEDLNAKFAVSYGYDLYDDVHTNVTSYTLGVNYNLD
ncbi:MAG: hypothetical protein ACOCQW_00035 [Halanaerobiaceae bacterium]